MKNVKLTENEKKIVNVFKPCLQMHITPDDITGSPNAASVPSLHEIAGVSYPVLVRTLKNLFKKGVMAKYGYGRFVGISCEYAELIEKRMSR